MKTITEEEYQGAYNPWAVIAMILILALVAVWAVTQRAIPIAMVSGAVVMFILKGFKVIQPQTGALITLFGDYKGTIKTNGFFWINPLTQFKPVSFRFINLETKKIKVNDKRGNPIEIGGVVVFRVEDTVNALLNVDNYHQFAETQAESAVRNLAQKFAYDIGSDEHEKTLLKNTDEVNKTLEEELNERFQLAGLHIEEAKITHLAYATEIAQSMLRLQQAEAVIAARKKIVEGAMQIVEATTKSLDTFDPKEKNRLITNLLVVLCSENGTQPIINAAAD